MKRLWGIDTRVSLVRIPKHDVCMTAKPHYFFHDGHRQSTTFTVAVLHNTSNDIQPWVALLFRFFFSHFYFQLLAKLWLQPVSCRLLSPPVLAIKYNGA